MSVSARASTEFLCLGGIDERARLSLCATAIEAKLQWRGAANEIDHSHHQLEFNLIVAGKGTYSLEDGHYDLVPGTLVWLLPDKSHRLMRSPDFDMWVATIEPESLDDEFLSDVGQQPCRSLASEDAIALDRLFSHVC